MFPVNQRIPSVMTLIELLERLPDDLEVDP